MHYYQHKTVCRTNVDAFGNTTQMEYDTYHLLLHKVTDAMGNETMVHNDYYTLQPKEIIDPNLNHSEVAFDALGMVIATAIKGKEISSGIWEGDNIHAPTVQMTYDLHCWKDQQKPVYVHTQARETHKDAATNWLHSYTYSDGLGRELQTKVQAEDGLAWQLDANGQPERVQSNTRWTATGRTIYNNKGKTIKQYEPWFSTTAAYESETELTQYGVTPVMHYDPLGRLIQTDLPDGNTTKVIFDAWQQANYDQNDNKADHAHANTPQIQHLDNMGRLFLTQDDNGSHGAPVYIDTRQQYNISGQVEQVQDAKGRWMTSTLYNMLGEPIHTYNIDSGHQWQLSDVAQKPLAQWNSRGHQTKHTYDSLQRPLNVVLTKDSDSYTVNKTVYGTDATKNNIGQIESIFDQSGKQTIAQYDFKGNPLQVVKQFCEDYQNTIDWNATPVLKSETFTQQFAYDAMNRLLSQSMPDGTVITHTYNKAGLLETVKKDSEIFVSNINYNEKGQRSEIYYGNNTKTKYEYDTNTFRLTRLLTTRNNGADILQDLNYTYDPVGNILEINDLAQQTHYFNNAVVEPKGQYEYDALYRLIKATGRELASLQIPTHTDFPDNIGMPNTAAHAMQNYTQQFQYDELGNILQMKSNGKWTRDYSYNENNNYLQGHTENTTEYSYDAHGNMLSMPHLSTMVWDYKDELKEVDLDGGGTAYYVYNSNGDRVRKVIKKGNIKEERYYLGGYEIYRKITNGNLDIERETIHISDDQKRIAMVDNNGTNETIRYQYDNHLGSASLELDENAEIISYEEYHPFGTTSYRSGRTETEVSLKRYKYVGKERDEETGLYYYGARYYAGWIGRFVSIDPLQFDYPHYTPYQYAGNKPISYIDLDGLEEAKPDNTTNFYIKIGDAQAKKDILSLAKSSKNSNFIKFRDDGGVYLDFGKKSNKSNKILKKDEGLQLISDLSQATYKDDNGEIKSAKILYQTEEPFDFSGYKEIDAKPHNAYSKHTKGSDAVVIDRLRRTHVQAFSYNASVTTYGKDNSGKTQNTLLPKEGFQGQVAIAPGTPTIFLGYREVNEIHEFEQIKGQEPVITNKRKDLIKHELRENLYRTQEGKSYIEAHTLTNKQYFPNWNVNDIKLLKFIWK